MPSVTVDLDDFDDDDIVQAVLDRDLTDVVAQALQRAMTPLGKDPPDLRELASDVQIHLIEPA